MPKLTKQEQETIIVFNEAEDTTSVDTCNPALIRKLDKLIALQESEGIALISEDQHGKRYLIPKRWVKVNPPPVYSEEQRAKMAATARARFGHGGETAEAVQTTPEKAPQAVN